MSVVEYSTLKRNGVNELAGGTRLVARSRMRTENPLDGELCQISQQLDVAGAPLSWLVIEHAQRPDGVSVVTDQGSLMYFLFRLLSHLQSLGTVRAIDWAAYSRIIRT